MLYICGIFRFKRVMDELERKLKEEKMDYSITKKKDNRGILGCLEKIDEADVVYVINPEGYIGKSVSVDIGYDYAKNKQIYALHPIEDPPVMKLINAVLSFEELITLLKK